MTNKRRKLDRFDKKAILIKKIKNSMDNISKSYNRILFPLQRVLSGEPKEALEMFRNDQRAKQVGQIC